MGECSHKYRSVVKERSLKNDNMYNNITILKMDIISLTGKKGQ
ncbi:hypothetical protein [Clostridium thailandense]